ncbi:Protein pob1, partial [Smittium mucronatum]
MTTENDPQKSQMVLRDLSMPPSSKDPRDWSVDDVCAWLMSSPYLSDLVPTIKAHSLDGHILINYISNAVLREELGVLAFGKRVRFLEALEALKYSIELSNPLVRTESSNYQSPESRRTSIVQLDTDMPDYDPNTNET